MQTAPQFFVAIGCILLLGLATDLLGRRTFLPRVTLLLIFGMLVGPEALNLIPLIVLENFEVIANVALMMIGFVLGVKLTKKTLSRSARQVICISISAALLTCLMVMLGLFLLGVPLALAILLGCIASATAPAATVETVAESNSKSPFANKLLSIVALDDAWALILFSIGVAIVSTMNGSQLAFTSLIQATHEIGGAILLGMVIGLPAAYLTGRIKNGQPMLTEALGLVFLCGGLALWLEVSFLIAAITMGVVITNLARHHDYPFHAIEGIEWPFMVVFFILAGASFKFDYLQYIGLTGVAYILLRVLGKVVGAGVGGRCGRADKLTRQWMGLALLPQAGAAMGMALVAVNQFPEYRQLLLTVVISTTVVFELTGPILARMALSRAARP